MTTLACIYYIYKAILRWDQRICKSQLKNTINQSLQHDRHVFVIDSSCREPTEAKFNTL